MDPNEIVKLMAQQRESQGQRIADMPKVISNLRGEIFGNDPTTDSLRANQTSKIQELYGHDKRLADTYANPSSNLYIENPYAREAAISTQAGATAGEIGDITNMISKRHDVLGSALENAIKMLNYGLEAEKLKSSGLQDQFNAQMSLEDLKLKKAAAAKGTETDQQSAAYDQMIQAIKDHTSGSLPETIAKYGKWFKPTAIYNAWNQINSDVSRQKNWGPAVEGPDVLKQIGVDVTSGDQTAQWEDKKRVLQEAQKAKDKGNSPEQIQAYIKSQGYNPLTDADFLGVGY